VQRAEGKLEKIWAKRNFKKKDLGKFCMMRFLGINGFSKSFIMSKVLHKSTEFSTGFSILCNSKKVTGTRLV
jgi:hypothetical protein